MGKMIWTTILSAACLVPLLGHAGEWAPPGEPVRSWLARAHVVGQDSSDQALAALYQRLFRLQDIRREAELKIESAEFVIVDLSRDYRKLDRRVDSPELLREIAEDPDHHRYPGQTESSKLKILAEVCKQMRGQKLARLEIKKIERDIKDVKGMIREHLGLSRAAGYTGE